MLLATTKKMDLRQVQSQPPAINRGSDVNYHWICIFNWCENDPRPFEIHVREVTKGYIPESWFKKPLSAENRQQKASFKPFGKKILSVFCKIEFGMYLN